MEVQEEITHKYQCPQSNEHIQCSQCGTMLAYSLILGKGPGRRLPRCP